MEALTLWQRLWQRLGPSPKRRRGTGHAAGLGL